MAPTEAGRSPILLDGASLGSALGVRRVSGPDDSSSSKATINISRAVVTTRSGCAWASRHEQTDHDGLRPGLTVQW